MTDDTVTAPIVDDGGSRAEDRIRALSQERKQLRAQIEEMTSRLEAASELSKQAETYKAQVTEWEQKFGAAESTWKVERELFARGITDAEGIDFVRMAYDRLPAEGRPELGAWLEQSDALPKAVRAYLPGGATPTPASPGSSSTGPQTITPPPANAGTKAPSTGTGAPSTFSPEAISRMSPAEYRAARETILGNLRG